MEKTKPEQFAKFIGELDKYPIIERIVLRLILEGWTETEIIEWAKSYPLLPDPFKIQIHNAFRDVTRIQPCKRMYELAAEIVFPKPRKK